MAGEFADHSVASPFAEGLDGVAYVSDARTLFCFGYAFVEGFFGVTQELEGLGVDFADGECIGGVAVVAVKFDYGVNADDVAVA